MAETERPEFVTEEHLQYLDDLRESGITNMYGSAPYVEAMFPEFTSVQARDIVGY